MGIIEIAVLVLATAAMGVVGIGALAGSAWRRRVNVIGSMVLPEPTDDRWVMVPYHGSTDLRCGPIKVRIAEEVGIKLFAGGMQLKSRRARRYAARVQQAFAEKCALRAVLGELPKELEGLPDPDDRGWLRKDSNRLSNGPVCVYHRNDWGGSVSVDDEDVAETAETASYAQAVRDAYRDRLLKLASAEQRTKEEAFALLPDPADPAWKKRQCFVYFHPSGCEVNSYRKTIEIRGLDLDQSPEVRDYASKLQGLQNERQRKRLEAK